MKKTVKLTLKLIGPLVYAAGFSEKELEFTGPVTAGELLSRANIDKKRPVIITRNGAAITPADELVDGDRVVISPIYSGG